MSQAVLVLGLGEGPGDLGPEARAALTAARVLAGGERQLAWFPEAAGQRLVLRSDLAGWLEAVAAAAEGPGPVVVLASGDPLFHGVGARLLARLGPAALAFRPAPTLVQAAFARLREPWQEVPVVSLHGRGWLPLWWALWEAGRAAVYTDPRNSPAAIAAELLALGGAEDWRLRVLEDLGGPAERVGTYGPAEAAARDFHPLNLVVVESRGAPSLRGLGLPEESYRHQAGLITKAEHRAVALARLALRPGHCLWDLGAGSGALGLEAGPLLRGGRVLAVEKDPGRAAEIRANRRRCAAGWLTVVEGAAPAALYGLPDPDRVFVGGGGAHLGAILAASAARLRPGGVILVSLVRLEGLEEARHGLAAAGLTVELTQVMASRGAPLAGGTRLKALDPLWLVRGERTAA